MVHTVLCTTSLETKKSETSIFCSNLAFVDKQQKPDLIRKTKNTSCAHWCFWCPEVGFDSKVYW